MRAHRFLPALLLPALLSAPGPAAAQVVELSDSVPYVPTPPEVVEAMLRVARVGPTDLVYDLGSGDGRIVVAAAREFGARGVGVDIDPVRVREARANAREAGVDGRVQFRRQDLFETDLREATVVTLYLLPMVNYRLRPKLLEDLRPGTRIVSHAFDMDAWEPDSTLNVNGRHVFYWVIPADVAGEWEWSLGGERHAAEIRQNFQRLQGEVAAGERRLPLGHDRVVGDRVRFVVSDRSGGEAVQMEFEGRIEGDRITGTVSVDRGPLRGTHDWVALRRFR